MKVHRSKHTEHFTILPNAALRDPRLSYRARGVLMELLSRPEDWQATADSLSRTAKKERGKKGEGRDAMRGAFAELKAAGYIVASRIDGESGTHTTELHVYDVAQDVTSEDAQNPRSDRGTENQASVNQSSADQSSENQASLRRTGDGSTDTKDCSTKDSSSSAPVTPEPEPAPVAEKKTRSPEAIVIERLGCTEDEARIVVDYIEQQGTSAGEPIRNIVAWVTNRPDRDLSRDLAHVRRHSAAPTVTECADHHQTMPTHGCGLCAGEIKAGDPDDIARLRAHLAMVGEKARPDLARLLGAPQTAPAPRTGGGDVIDWRRIQKKRSDVVGGSRNPVADHAFYSQHTDDELKARFLG